MYTIGQVAEMFDLPISTLRYYDKQGLFPNMERVSGIRKFSEAEIEALRSGDQGHTTVFWMGRGRAFHLYEPQGDVRSQKSGCGRRNEAVGKNSGYAEIQMLVL